LNVDTKNMTMI